MRQLTTRQRFALTLSVYVFAFLIIAFGIFLVFFEFKTQRDVQSELSKNAKEIIGSYLIFDRGTIQFRIAKTGLSLKAYLTTEAHAAIFIDNNNRILRTYGLFAVDDRNNPEKMQELLALSQATLQHKTIQNKTISWERQSVKVMILPLSYNGGVVGALILGKSLSDLAQFRNIIVITFIAMAGLSFIGSLLLGKFLSHMAFDPIIAMQHTIEHIDLDKLDGQIVIPGHPQDETALLAKKFNDMITRLREASARQKDFISNASHELKTPLTRIISTIDAAQPNTIAVIRNELFSLNELIDRLLLLAKLNTAQRQRVKPHTINPHVMVNGVIRQYETKLKNKNISIVKSIPEIVTISMPLIYLKAILSNFVSNAIKYSSDNSTVSVRCFTNGEESIIEVADHGSGMDDQEKAQAFNRFYRGSNTYTTKGFGIGLSLVKQIADTYSAKIIAISSKNKGTTISIVMRAK